MAGVPNGDLTFKGVEYSNSNEKVNTVFEELVPGIDHNAYKITVFPSAEGRNTHICRVIFDDYDTKMAINNSTSKLRDIEDIKSLFIRWGEPRYTRLENSRLRTRRDNLSAVVPPPPSASHRPETPAVLTRETRCDTPSSPHANHYGSSFVRTTLQKLGLPAATEDLICASWRKGTQSQYSSSLKSWRSFCTTQKVDPYTPSIKDILHFLTELYNTGAVYSVIATARSALSGIISIPGIPSISEHLLVKRLLKGCITIDPTCLNILLFGILP